MTGGQKCSYMKKIKKLKPIEDETSSYAFVADRMREAVCHVVLA